MVLTFKLNIKEIKYDIELFLEIVILNLFMIILSLETKFKKNALKRFSIHSQIEIVFKRKVIIAQDD